MGGRIARVEHRIISHGLWEMIRKSAILQKNPGLPRDFIADAPIRHCSPKPCLGTDFQESRDSNVLVGRLSARTHDSRKLPHLAREISTR